MVKKKEVCNKWVQRNKKKEGEEGGKMPLGNKQIVIGCTRVNEILIGAKEEKKRERVGGKDMCLSKGGGGTGGQRRRKIRIHRESVMKRSGRESRGKRKLIQE